MPTIAQSHHVHGDACEKELQLNLPTRSVSASMESPRAPNSFLAAQSPLDAYFDGPQHPSFHFESSLEPECSRTIANPTLLKSLRHSCSSSAQKEKHSKQMMHVMVDRTNGHLMCPLKPKQGSSVKGHVWSLSQDADGCREVQEAFDEAISEQDRVLLAMELVGHVREAVECPHANHVLRKCITTMLPSSVQFVIDEFVKGGAEAMREAARHRYGCRILEALLKKCSVEQMCGLVHYFLNDSLALMTHMYGNFIVQRLLEHGTQEHRRFLCAVIQMNILIIATNFYGAVVVGSALTYGARDDQLLLARTILVVNGLLRSLMRFRHGEIVKQRLFEILEPGDYLLVRYELQAAPLKVSRNMQNPVDRKLPNLVADVQVRTHRSRRQASTKM
mmetsp:Transcript_113795/g.179061  ORF Transcript_113795/g.179061 Transcript_113795/m.179061 type:complete len:390 (+) Transcript_113795:45-1214(+)